MFTEKCDELCGYAAAIAAALSYGSFGVPVKSEVAKRLDVDPLVMQSYKSIMCFLCCWLIIPMGELSTNKDSTFYISFLLVYSLFILFHLMITKSNRNCVSVKN